MLVDICEGLPTVVELLATQPKVSVTVTEYVPGRRPLVVAEESPVDHK